MFRAIPGQLPAADAGDLAGIALPPGRIVVAREGTGEAVAWISTDLLPAAQLEELICALAAVFLQTGLWPLHAEGHPEGRLDQPWAFGEMDGPEGEIPDALTVLTRDDDGDRSVPPVTELASPQPGPELDAGAIGIGVNGRLLLVPVARPADVPAALGWWGGTNYGLSGADFSAVLRSWEDRFGAVLISIGFATMAVQVGRRPVLLEQLDALLREHYAFCPDNIDQGLPPEVFRDGLAEWNFWSFWWD